MTNQFDQPFEEHDEIVGVTVLREDLRQLLVVAAISQLDEQARTGKRNARLQLAMDRIGAAATGAESPPEG